MNKNECDIGFLNLPVASDEDIKIEKSIAFLNDIFIAGKKFSELKGKALNVQDLLKYPLLLMEEHTVSRESVDSYGVSHGVDFKPAVEVNSWGFMKHLVMNGMGIGCIPREYSINKLSNGSLFELNVNPPLPVRSVGMALPKKVLMTFALQSFICLFL